MSEQETLAQFVDGLKLLSDHKEQYDALVSENKRLRSAVKLAIHVLEQTCGLEFCENNELYQENVMEGSRPSPFPFIVRGLNQHFAEQLKTMMEPPPQYSQPATPAPAEEVK